MKEKLRTIAILIGVSSLVILGASACSTYKAKPVDSLEAAQEIVVKKAYKDGIGERALFASPMAKESGVMIGTWPTPERVLVPKDSWFFFVDEAPGANWEHPAKILLVDKRNGKLRAYDVKTPPREFSAMTPVNAAAMQQAEILERNRQSIRDMIVDRPVQILKMDKYAVLVSGGWNAGANYARYWNDLSFIYTALKNKYGFLDSEIIVLYANGTHLPDEDLDGDGVDDIDYSATKSNLETVMKHVGRWLGADGKFFFYSTNHGGYESGHDAYLYLWGETILDDEFGELTKNIKSKHAIYVMEQCYSGGMMDDILTAQTYPCNQPRVCVMTAARHDEVSWAADTEGAYDEYVYHWTSAIYGQTPTGTTVDADTNGDGVVSMDEAHTYAKTEDSRDEHPLIGSCVTNACGASLYVTPPLDEDCVGFNPDTTTVQQIDGRWKLVDGSHWLFDFGASSAEANQTLAIVKNYGMNQSCFVGRPDPSFQYMLVAGNSPTGSMSGEDCVSFNLQNIKVQQVSGSWKIVDNGHWLFDFGTNRAEAETSLRIIKKYGFTRSCFVGRPDASFLYLRK